MLHAFLIAIAIVVVGITTGRLIAFNSRLVLAVGLAMVLTALALSLVS